MHWSSLQFSPCKGRCRRGFSLLEVTIAVVITSLLATLAIQMVSSSKVAVVDTKLRTDVVRLNQIISLYLSDGGSLTGVTTPQAVLDKIKTVRTTADSIRQVGALTGRGVDVRLATRAVPADRKTTADPRAVWNGTTNRFEITTTPNTDGVADFVLDDSLLTTNYPTETRTRTAMLYNNTNGWVWTAGTYSPASYLTPVDVSVAAQENVFDPTSAPPTVALPAPVITPAGGTFTNSTFPSTVTMNANGAPGGSSSQLQYKVNHSNGTSTAWTVYSSAVAIISGDTVQAKNVSTNTAVYTDSATTSQTYVSSTPVLPTPVINTAGGTFTSATFPGSVTISSNGAPGGSSSQLQYMVTHSNGTSTAWMTYSTAVTIASGDTVTARNYSTSTGSYTTSSSTSKTYVIGIVALPTPVITPTGGTFTIATLPTSVSISANGAPGGSTSTLKYMITHADGTSTAWTTYTAAVAIINGDTVQAKNVSTNTATYSDSSTTSQNYRLGAATTLPKPINSPSGGTFSAAAFPTTISVNRNGAPTTGSQLKYRINSGTWINYTTAVTISSGQNFQSKNFTTDTVLYADSSTDSDTYYRLVTSFAGTSVPTWTNVSGGPSLQHTNSNSNPDSVTLTHGDTRLDLGGGEFLDAGVANTMTYNRVNPFANVQPNTDFTLGEFIVLNGTTFNDSEATAATLSIAFTLNQPSTQSGTVALNFTMVSTANTSDRLASADTVTINNPVTSFTVTQDGITYTLQVRLVGLDETSGTVSGSTFYTYEGASARASLVGKFVSNR